MGGRAGRSACVCERAALRLLRRFGDGMRFSGLPVIALP
jgi:hypothetical protein